MYNIIAVKVKINNELEIEDAGCAQQPFDLLATMIG